MSKMCNVQAARRSWKCIFLWSLCSNCISMGNKNRSRKSMTIILGYVKACICSVEPGSLNNMSYFVNSKYKFVFCTLWLDKWYRNLTVRYQRRRTSCVCSGFIWTVRPAIDSGRCSAQFTPFTHWMNPLNLPSPKFKYIYLASVLGLLRNDGKSRWRPRLI